VAESARQLGVVLFLTLDSAACITATIVRPKQHHEMISVLLRSSGENCQAFPGNHEDDSGQETFRRQNQLSFKQVTLADHASLLCRLECGETQATYHC
jgi:hypothetical protein